jgi:hypothetical protein
MRRGTATDELQQFATFELSRDYARGPSVTCKTRFHDERGINFTLQNGAILFCKDDSTYSHEWSGMTITFDQL